MNNKSEPQVIMVEASAGSGKTYALGKRYLKLLFKETSKPAVIRDILAITFSRQAAREMKERILEFLKKIAFDEFGSESEKTGLYSGIKPSENISGSEMKSRALLAVDYIIKNYNQFQVQTIDSFMNTVLAGCSFRGGLSAALRIKERHREFLSYSLDKIIDDALSDPSLRGLFDAFLKQYLFVENKTLWLPKKSVLDVLDSMLYRYSVYGKPYARYGKENSGIFEQRSFVNTLIKTLAESLPEGTKSYLVKALAKLTGEESDFFDLAVFANSKTLTSRQFPANKNAVIPKSVESLWADYLRALEKLATEEALAVFNCYTDLFNKTQDVLDEYCRREDTVFLRDLNAKARGLVKNNSITLPELYMRLASVYRHFLIDEFQDTSVLRWENLSEMVKNALSVGGSLFFVGDKKQAIFRFSGGDVQLGKAITEELAGFNPVSVSLEHNYRSQKRIVDFNNAVFAQENIAVFLAAVDSANEDDFKKLEDFDKKYVLDVFSNARQKHDPGKTEGRVSVKELACDAKEDKLDIIKKEALDKARELTKRHAGEEVAFLCRTNSQVELLSGWLAEAGFGVESEKTLDIRNNFLVAEIISFLKFMNSPIDNIAFAGFVTGEAFGAKTGIEKEKMLDFIFALNQSRKQSARRYLYTAFRENFAAVWGSYFDEFYKSANSSGVYETAAAVIAKFDILANFPDMQGFVMHLLELIKLKEGECAVLGEFLDFFAESEKDEKAFFLNPVTRNAVKVLTVHKSKGLAFDAVVVPFFEISANELSGSNRKGKTSYALLPESDTMSLIRLDKKYAVLSGHIRKVYMSEYRKSIVDELCAAYVAFTRARNELHILLPCPTKLRKNFAQALLSNNLTDPPAAMPAPAPSPRPENYLKVGRLNVCGGSISRAQTEAEGLSEREEKKLGSILHYMLSLVRPGLIGGLETVLNEIKTKTKMKFPNCKNIESLLGSVERLLTDEKTKGIFTSEGLIFNEKEFADEFGNIKRFDRVIVKKDEALIIDYKTSLKRLEEYTRQMQGYARIAAGVYQGKKIRTILVSVSDCGVVEL